MQNSGYYRAPSQRANDDANRLKVKASRFGLNPGPGTYDPRRPGRTLDDLAGSTAFKSKSDRKNDASLKGNGDPGAYNPYDHMTIGSVSHRSFNKSQQTGAEDQDHSRMMDRPMFYTYIQAKTKVCRQAQKTKSTVG